MIFSTPQMKETYKKVLSIAGSDSSGGAGIQADLKTVSALGCYGMTVITALTAQNTQGVNEIHPVPPEFVAAQMSAVFNDLGTDAVKIGMLYSGEMIRTIADLLKKYKVKNIVLDPVMAAQSGGSLAKDDVVDAIKKELLPVVDILTPNIPETCRLLGRDISKPEEIESAAVDLSTFGTAYILIKGGHLESKDASDWLYASSSKQFLQLREKRISTQNNHGTGCTLSSAIAAFLARGETMETAVRQAKSYLTRALLTGADYKIGHGCGPVHHFHSFWK